MNIEHEEAHKVQHGSDFGQKNLTQTLAIFEEHSSPELQDRKRYVQKENLILGLY